MNPASTQKRIAFGYNRNYDIELNPGQAGCVWLIFSYYDEGNSLAEIKDILEGMNIPSPQNKKVWGKQTISNILSNPHYLGSEEYPKIIEQDLFDRVQQRKAKQTLSAVTENRCFSGSPKGGVIYPPTYKFY